MVASNIGCTTGEVNLYVSLNSTSVISIATQMLPKEVFGNTKIILPQCLKQLGHYNCGLFAIAFCTALAHGEPLSEVAFNQDTMWHHFNNALSNLK